jgi:ribosome-associated protein
VIQITPDLAIDESEIQVEFVRASGPGGQHVNRVATAVQLRFDVANSPSLPDDVRARLVHLAGRRMTKDGVLLVESQRFRTQERNRQDALERLIVLIRQAAKKPKRRRKTRPTRASKERRLENKRRQSEKKRLRKPDSYHHE